MANDSGTATDYLDLLTKLRDFLTTNTDLVTAGEEWEVIGGLAAGPMTTADFLSFKGQGLGGTDQIFVSLSSYTSVPGGLYQVLLRGHTAYNPGAPGVDQVGSDSKWVYLPLANSSLAYWFYANGRHFKVVTRLNGRYDAMYAGFILPEHLPDDWSYPLFIGGSTYAQTVTAASDQPHHSNFWNPNASARENGGNSCAYLFSPIQAWVPIRNSYNDGPNLTGARGRVSVPWSNAMSSNVRRCLDNTAWFTRGQLVGFGYDTAYGAVGFDEMPELGTFYGAYDGVFYSPAFAAVAEAIITDPVSGREYQLFPNVFRTGDSEFAAFELE